jgi:hypothetical protein
MAKKTKRKSKADVLIAQAIAAIQAIVNEINSNRPRP